VLQWGAVRCRGRAVKTHEKLWQCVAVCYSVVQYVAACCSVLLYVAACCRGRAVKLHQNLLRCVAISVSVLQCVAVCGSVSHCVAEGNVRIESIAMLCSEQGSICQDAPETVAVCCSALQCVTV